MKFVHLIQELSTPRIDYSKKEVMVIHHRVIISYELWKENLSEEKFLIFTGLSKCNFEALYILLGGEESIRRLKSTYNQSTPKKKLRKYTVISAKSRLLLLLVRLRRGTPIVDLSYQFGIGIGHASSICYSVLRKLKKTFESVEKVMFHGSCQEDKNRPEPFKPFPNVKVIIDGAEFKIETPSNFEQQGNTWSAYKHNNTSKFLIGISFDGAVIFVSRGFEGNKSDKEITNACGLKDYLKKGDAVMCDRGFDIAAELLEIGVKTIKPPHLGSRKSFTPQEQLMNSAIAQSRIYVEHAIGKIKEFRLLRNVIPLGMRGEISDWVYVAGYLTNFGNRSVK